jgi:hypothetical protein
VLKKWLCENATIQQQKKSIIWIYKWTHWTTRWQPAQFTHVVHFHQTVPKLTVLVDWQPRPPLWQRFGSNLDWDVKWQSGTVANTNRDSLVLPDLSLTFPDLSPVFPSLLLVVTRAPKLLSGAPKCYRTYQTHSNGTPDQWAEIPGTLKTGWNARLASDAPLKLTHLCLHSTSWQTLLEASSD